MKEKISKGTSVKKLNKKKNTVAKKTNTILSGKKVGRYKHDLMDNLPDYFHNLLSSISPIATFDETHKIRFVNNSFCEEFKLKRGDILGKDITAVFRMNKRDTSALLENIDRSIGKNIENAEFSTRNRIFGYSLFHFENETGIILKEITKIKQLQKQVESLHARMLRVQERERQKIAAELHDSVGQTILAAKLNFSAYHIDPEKMKERFETGMSLIDRASQELREIYTDLYPSILRDLGIEAAIRWYAKNFVELKDISTNLKISLKQRLSQYVEVGIFRMVQELFNNIVKHSHANHVSLRLNTNRKGTVILEVIDDGVGFSMDEVLLRSRGMGLENIRSRTEDLGGIMRVDTEPGKGTKTLIQLSPASENKTENSNLY